MRFRADSHFVIGGRHVLECLPGQDYALTGTVGDMAYAVVSDGCSGGARTDIGARLVALSAEHAIRDVCTEAVISASPIAYKSGFISSAQRQVLASCMDHGRFGLTVNDLVATCMYACAGPKGITAHVRGDGVVAVVRPHGLTLHLFAWPLGAPYYPIYSVEGLGAFVDLHGGNRGAAVLREEIWTRPPGSGFTILEEKHHSIADGIKGISLEFAPNDVDMVALFSDGVCDFHGASWIEVIAELLAFKSPDGIFAKRRMKSYVREMQKRGGGPNDDLAFACIRIDRERADG